MPAKNYTKRPHIEGYRLTTEISANAFSRILLAERISSNNHEQPVVIKWLYATPISVQQDRDSFQREIHSLRSVHYPHIVPILSSGFLEEDNTPYLVMEYAPKGSLAERLQDRQALSHNSALAILDQIGQALHYAHQWNITHGNLKPQNVLFDATGGALLTDFHLNTGPLHAATAFDETSVYTAPEQLTGQGNQKSDLYALGCLAYEMFTGHKPFMTPSKTMPGIYYRTRRPSAPRMLNPQLPQCIENAIMQAIEKEPEQRQSDIPAFLAALRGSDSTAEQEKETTLPTLPMVAASLNVPIQTQLQMQQTTNTPEIAAPADVTAATETTSFVGQVLQNSALVPRASPALLTVDSGSPKRNLRHYLAVSVLLAYVTSFKPRRIFLPAISFMNEVWLSDLRDITRNKLRFKRPAWPFIIMASLLVAAMTGMLTLLLFAPHAPQGKGLVQATSTQTLSPQIQPGSTPTIATHSTPAITATTQSITFALTAVPTSLPTTVSTSNSSSTSSTSNSSDNSSNSSNSSDNSSTSSASPTPDVTAGSTPTQAPSTPPTPTPMPPQPTPTPTPTQIPTPTPTPIPASSCRVSYVAPSQWQGGFGVNMVVTNTGGSTINGWTLNFSFPGNQRITSGWGGHFSQQGNQVTVTDSGYNAQIAAHASVSLGFLSTWSGSNPNPTSFSLNGIQCQ